MPRITEVTVSPCGETSVQTGGYAGGDCRNASRFLEQALGVTTAETRAATPPGRSGAKSSARS